LGQALPAEKLKALIVVCAPRHPFTQDAIGPRTPANDQRRALHHSPATPSRHLDLKQALAPHAMSHSGGCNGARIRFEPMKSWPQNKGLDKALQVGGRPLPRLMNLQVAES
jgi:hypothetical protein